MAVNVTTNNFDEIAYPTGVATNAHEGVLRVYNQTGTTSADAIVAIFAPGSWLHAVVAG